MPRTAAFTPSLPGRICAWDVITNNDRVLLPINGKHQKSIRRAQASDALIISATAVLRVGSLLTSWAWRDACWSEWALRQELHHVGSVARQSPVIASTLRQA